MIIQERLKEIEGKTLIKGSGRDIDHGCVMQMVSYVAGEPWTDQPECACPMLTRYAIRLNDRLSDARRQGLKAVIPLLVDTRDETLRRTRANFICWRSVAVTFPLLTDYLKRTEVSAYLRAVENNAASLRAAAEYLRAKRAEIRTASDAYAAYAAAADAADADAHAAYAAAADADADAYAAAYAAYAAAYAAADADADAYAAAYAAYADADAYAAAYAPPIGDAIAASAIETLRLACEMRSS
jgi:hypothetical protein